MQLTDEQITKSVVNGDTKLYKEIVSRYEDKLLRYVKYITQDNDIAEDIVQDTFIKAYQNLKSFDTKKKFSSWIYRIAHNEAVNKLKKRKFEIFHIDFEFLGELIHHKESPEKDYERKEIVYNVQKALNDLPVKYRDILTLYYLEDKSYEEISDILRISMGTVATRISRGKAKLKKMLVYANNQLY